MTTMYFIIAAALLAKAGLYAYFWFTFHSRRQDVIMMILFVMFSLSFGLYGVEHQWVKAILIERVLDVAICIVVVYTFIDSSMAEIRRIKSNRIKK